MLGSMLHVPIVSPPQSKAKAYNTYMPPEATAAEAALLCHRHSGRTAYRPQAKPAPTNFDLQPNGHTQTWSAV